VSNDRMATPPLRILCAAVLLLSTTPARTAAQAPAAQPAEAAPTTLALRQGDYVTATVSSPTAGAVQVIQPDGGVLRTWRIGPASAPIAFVALGDGPHRLSFTASPTVAFGAASPEPGVVANVVVTPLDARLQARIVDRSPMMRGLRERVAAGTWSPDAFWRDVAARGTPIVEPGDDAKYQWVTFLWRARGETRNVSVIGTFMKAPLAEPMQRIAGTDVWYRTFRIPAGARFSYFLSPNAPLVFDGPEAAQQMATLQADPLNPHRWMCAPDADVYQCQSRAELPGAAAQPWLAPRDTVAKGTLDRGEIASRHLGQTREVTVYRSSGATCERERCVLLVLFDGPQYLSIVPTPTILDNLRAAGRIPPVVAVFVTHVNRARELACHEGFAAFVATELVPWARARYGAGATAADVAVAGSSFGGLAAAFVALRHPDVVGNVLSQSGNFAWAPDHVAGPSLDTTTEGGWLIQAYVAAPAARTRFYLDAGLFEADRFVTGGAILESSRHFRDVLRAKGHDVAFAHFTGGHDYLSWRGTLADGLLHLIGSAPR
jgi:enterochelin esterase-like enzyme